MYCDLDDLKGLAPVDVLVQITDECGTGTIDLDKINSAIGRAETTINAYCGKMYRVPFDVVPDVIRDIAVRVALYNLYARRDFMVETRELQYKDAIRQLEGISKGLVSLGVEPAPASAAATSETAVFSSNEKVFGRKSLEGF